MFMYHMLIYLIIYIASKAIHFPLCFAEHFRCSDCCTASNSMYSHCSVSCNWPCVWVCSVQTGTTSDKSRDDGKLCTGTLFFRCVKDPSDHHPRNTGRAQCNTLEHSGGSVARFSWSIFWLFVLRPPYTTYHTIWHINRSHRVAHCPPTHSRTVTINWNQCCKQMLKPIRKKC